MQALSLEPGEIVFAKYRVERLLGAGGMGIVYAATHLHLHQRVALKFLSPRAAAEPELVERFSREARAAAKIQSDHVARVLDVGVHVGDVPFIVMEYLEGQSLDALLKEKGTLPLSTAVDYLLQACEALAEAHAHGIVHRDVKPANIFLAKRPGRSVIKVLDFGISKLPPTTLHYAITVDSMLIGSPGYMAPEQMLAASTADARSDIWGIGSVLYHMLSGRPPFKGERMAALVAAVIHTPHVPLGVLAPHLPVEVEAVVERCLQKDPANRPGSVAEVTRLLAPFGPPGSHEAADRVLQILTGSLTTHTAKQASTGAPATAAPPIDTSKTLVDQRDTIVAAPVPKALSAPPPPRAAQLGRPRRAPLVMVPEIASTPASHAPQAIPTPASRAPSRASSRAPRAIAAPSAGRSALIALIAFVTAIAALGALGVWGVRHFRRGSPPANASETPENAASKR